MGAKGLEMRKLLSLLSVLSVPALAAPHCKAELLCQQTAVVAGQPLRLWVKLTPEAGWHTYWQNPGQSGIETTLQWTLPPGFAPGPIRWSLPERMEDAGIVNYGYSHSAVHEVLVSVPKQVEEKTITVKVKANWLICSAEECLPGGQELQLQLPVAQTAGLAEWPEPTWPLPAPKGLSLHQEASNFVLEGELPQGKLEFFPSSGLQIDESAPQKVDWQSSKFHLQIPAARTSKKLERLQGLLVSGEGKSRRGYSIDFPIGGPSQ